MTFFPKSPTAYHIRSYRKGDESGILEMFPRCFFVSRSMSHWRWKYRNNPYGRHMLCVATTEDGKIVAHYGGFPVPFRLSDEDDGRMVTALQVGDSMTHPDVRGVGRGHTSLIARTADAFLSAHAENRLAFSYGFNTGTINRFCIRYIGGSTVEPVRYWSGAVKVAAARSVSTTYNVKRVRRLGNEWDAFFHDVAPAYGSLVARARQYLNWRYMSCPDRCFLVFAAYCARKLVGWSVFRRRDDTMVWGDSLFHPDHVDAASSILAAAAGCRAFSGSTTVAAWFSRYPQFWSQQLPRLGFVQLPEPNRLVYIYKPYVEQSIGQYLGTSYYTMGDADLF